jgi:hypothetical protein
MLSELNHLEPVGTFGQDSSQPDLLHCLGKVETPPNLEQKFQYRNLAQPAVLRENLGESGTPRYLAP